MAEAPARVPSTPVKVLVIVPERRFQREDGSEDSFSGYWAAGRLWPTGETEAVLEDVRLPDLTLHDFQTGAADVKERWLTVPQQLKQLEHARGGQLMVDQYVERDGKVVQKKSPAMLSFRVLDDHRQAQTAGSKK
jgi:hypothetical protein